MDPFPAFRYELSLDTLPVAGFSEITGLQIEIPAEDYAEGGQNHYIHKFPGRTRQSNITLKRGIIDKLVWDWFQELMEGKVTFRDGTITLFDPSGGEEVMKWRILHAFPVKFMGPDLNASQNAVAIETVELAHQGLIREK
jgi:phage tail-like protein